ncbi:GntR family transcriptional regulator [Pedobacter nyackensis]|uniref:GntR family transcriptional regulator / MocR family aminotransferase n=1 Tax=Pedobacter nyackensis TaxID=475255 RepID=A0A1W2EX05_9SPHI|nr:GntR family transcriptional regulator [Pedobacter nyackensis]SMD14211.1 GntR family transcriptional regulator / MocR family aminotransferase [Pedobacter nyackensis]
MKKNYTINWLIPDLDKNKCTSQIEEFIINAVLSASLQPGDPVPPYRELAKLNDVGESSVRRAYNRLTNNNWLSSQLGSGTIISESNPTIKVPNRNSGFTHHFPAGFTNLSERSEFLIRHEEDHLPYSSVGADFPSPSQFPEERFAEYYNYYRETSRNLSQAELFSAYNGRELKDAVVEHLNRKRDFGLQYNMLDIIKGRKNCLERVFNILLTKGDIIINTTPHDTTLTKAIVKYEAIVYNLDRNSDDFIERIEQMLEYGTSIRALHIRPQCSFPESFSLNPEDCQRLVDLAKRYRICIIEEEDDHEFWYGSQPYKPLACYNHNGYVVYMGTLSKASPETQSLRLIVASVQFINELQSLPAQSIENRDIIKEKAIAEMIKNGDLAEYSRKVRIKSKTYRDELHIILNNHLDKYITYEIPEYGLTFWLKFHNSIDLNMVLERVDQMGIPVPYHPNNKKTNKKVNHMMLGFGAFDIHEAEGGAKMLNQVIKGLNIT